MSRPPTWDRIQALFVEALELAPAARDALLTREAAADPGLVREVRSLLSAHEDASGFLGGSAALDLRRTAAPGDRIGPYRIIEEVGRGGMGVVFRAARDDEDFSREVAIKLIDPGLRSDAILKRFRTERQILAMLDHPFIARLIDGGTAPDNSPFLVMDYVSGRPLLDYCDEHGLGIDGRLGIFLSVCDAVQFAHQRLVVHRDLKPDNILVTEDGTPRLLDFGIARILSPDPDGMPVTVTAPMNRLLTPDYASPEQIRGEPVTVSGDVYSLGVILYELLSGRRPLEFRTRTSEDILRVIAEEDPLLPSVALTRAPTGETAARRGETVPRLRRRLAGDLDDIALKALEKDPARRYGSVDQFAQDIRRHLEGLPVLARGESKTYRMSRFMRRHRTAVVAAALVMLSLIAGLAGTTWQAGVAGRERDRATRRFNEVRGLAHAVMFDIHDAIVDLPGSTKAREVLVDHALAYLNSLESDAKGDHALQHEIGVAYAKIGDVQGRPMFPNLGRTAEALDSYNRGLALIRPASEARPESLAYSRDLIVTTQRLSDLLRKMGRNEEAMTQAEAALRRIEATRVRYPNDAALPADLLLAHDRIGDMKLAAADTQGAIVERTFCMELAETMFRKDPRDAGWRRSVIINGSKNAEFMAARHDRGAALAAYRRAETLAREAVAALENNTEARRDLSIVLGFIGLFLADGGEVDSGLVVYGQGMKIAEEMAAEDPRNTLPKSDVAAGHFEIGGMLMKGRRYEPARRHFEEAFARFASLVAADSADVDSRISMARSARRAGDAWIALAADARIPVRSSSRKKALAWLETSLALHVDLERKGALTGEDAAAPAELTRQIAGLRR